MPDALGRRHSDDPHERRIRSQMPVAVIAALHETEHALWCDWVDGRIPGYPDDDLPLLRAQAEAGHRIRAAHGMK